MQIHGFQKMTLLDFPGRVACTLFTAGCNLRCPFCHNAFLVTQINENGALDEAEILAYLRSRRNILDGVCVTGGEPLLYPDTPALLKKIKDMGLLVKLDTNGTFPDRLQQVVRDGLVDYVAMDIKNAPEKYAATAGVPGLDITPVKESVAFLLQDTVDYEFRTTVVGEFHTAADMHAIGRWIRGAKRYYLQNFVDSGNLICADMHGVDTPSMQLLCDIAQQYVPGTAIRGI